MDDLTRRFLRLLVVRLPDHSSVIRATLHDALDGEIDTLLAPERPRLAPRRPPVVPSNDVPVDEIAQKKADKALRRLGYEIK